ncbi:hypothetical protein KCP71_00925 [Salmonella enterica subsp. enterica]|nr:hypothetical protein KCP71_00925 [Salmonella enterica subsp. enterica]
MRGRLRLFDCALAQSVNGLDFLLDAQVAGGGSSRLTIKLIGLSTCHCARLAQTREQLSELYLSSPCLKSA